MLRAIEYFAHRIGFGATSAPTLAAVALVTKFVAYSHTSSSLMHQTNSALISLSRPTPEGGCFASPHGLR